MDVGIFYEIQVASPLKHRDREARCSTRSWTRRSRRSRPASTRSGRSSTTSNRGSRTPPRPEVIYGALSQRTSVMRIGHGVVLLPFPYNHPVRVAERIATLDILSNGRVEMGTGRSITVQELGGFGIPPTETRAPLGGGARHHHHDLALAGRHVLLQGRLLRHPRAHGGADARAAAAPADLDRLHVGGHAPPGRGEGPRAAVLHGPRYGPRSWASGSPCTATREKGAQPMGQFVNGKAGAFGLVHCADTDAQAEEEAERAFMSYVGTTLAVSTPVLEARRSGRSAAEIAADPNREVTEYEGLDPRKVDLQYMIDNGMCIVGSPDTVIRQIERIQDAANLDLFLAMMQFWSIPHEKTMHAIDLFGRYVIPHFKTS